MKFIEIWLELKANVNKKKVRGFEQGDDVLRYKGTLSTPQVDEFQERIMEEDHISRFPSIAVQKICIVYWEKSIVE